MKNSFLNLKTFLITFFLGMAFVISGYGDDSKPVQWGPVTNGIRMAISLEPSRSAFTTNDAIVLSILYTNTSPTNAVYWWTAWPIEVDPDYSFLVETPSGVPQLVDFPGPVDTSGMIVNLQAGKSAAFTFDLGKRFQLAAAGKYTITAR